jgi:hypothetical protein
VSGAVRLVSRYAFLESRRTTRVCVVYLTFTCALGLKNEVLILRTPLIEVPTAATPCFVYLIFFVFLTFPFNLILRPVFLFPFFFELHISSFVSFSLTRVGVLICTRCSTYNRSARTANSRKRAGFKRITLYFLSITPRVPNMLIKPSTGYKTVLHGTDGISSKSTEISNDEI